MNIFGWRKNLTISEQDPTFKVRYLGNVQTSVMKGDGCTDRAVNVIWNTYTRSDHPGVEMKVLLTGSGIKAYTKEQGLTEYRAHRISYCIAHPQFPRVFVWVYRHEGRRMKMELRCHAVLCTSEAKARAMALRLHEKLSSSLKEFLREKLRKQTSRLALERTSSLPKTGAVLPLRTQLLSTANNFRGTPTAKANAANKLGAITEDSEEEEMMKVLEEEEEEDESEEDVDDILVMRKRFVLMKRASAEGRLEDNDNNNSTNENKNATRQQESESLPVTPSSSGPRSGLFHNGVEHHGIVQALDLDASSPSQNLHHHHHHLDSGAAAVDSPASSIKDGGNALREYMASDHVISLEIGNDLDELRRDDQVRYCLNEVEGQDSDEESAESGFHDQEASNPDQDIADSERALALGAGDGGEDKEDEIDELTVCRFPSLEGATDVLKNPLSEKTSL
ncbi:protein FAM43A [Elysia marginata]|uniref:Protein FAM43A n=1 Tax=Elysia marginata TaxID=1093978 RepID=A0AAV4FFN7_9GAST|nr:protein FAM43A [Elysia marginata]